jgi:hypothetical protein
VTRFRGWLPWIGILAALAVMGFLVQRPDDGDPLDPRSTKPLGAKALVELLEARGGDVAISRSTPAPGDDAETVLLLSDQLDDEPRRQLNEWIQGGGTLVVGDPTSAFGPGMTRANPFEGADLGDELERECGLVALAEVETIDPAGGVPLNVPDIAGLEATGCFPFLGGHYLVARRHGDGAIVALGGAAPLLNTNIDAHDNAVLAVALLAPTGGERIVVVDRPLPGTGRDTLLDVAPRGVKLFLIQLGIAFLLYAIARARRLGRPVLEPQPVEVPASDLVVAVGSLLHVARHRDQAAAMLREDLRRTLAERLGLPTDAHPDTIVETVRSRPELPGDRIAAVLADRPVNRDEDLVSLAQLIETVRQEVTRART